MTGRSTLVGNGAAGAGFADGLGLAARFQGPAGLALNTEGYLIVADSNNNCIRRVMTTKGARHHGRREQGA